MKLPPMNALRAFEAASRLGSVSKAADELCVSQGAVSQQLRNLEDHLGREMFIRTPNSFILSEEGEAFAAVVQRSLGEIGFAATEIARIKTQRKLTISAAPLFATKWLMPNLADFYESFPDVSIALDKSIRVANFQNDGIDGAIRFSDGEGGLDGLDSVLLFHTQIFAMASPAYITENGELESLAEPGQHRLIDAYYDSKKTRALQVTWEDVVSGHQIDPETHVEVFPEVDQVLNAALLGRGIALLPRNLVDEEIESGRIDFANPEPISAPYSCYFVSPANARPNSALIAFRDWLVDALKKFSAQGEPREASILIDTNDR
jgi:LysR family glycine cleavage system transcriptional activator